MAERCFRKAEVKGSIPLAGSKLMQKYQSSYVPRSVRSRERKAKRNIIITIIISIVLLYALITWGIPAIVGGASLVNKIKPKPSSGSVSNNAALAPPFLDIPFESTNSGSLRISGYAATDSEVEIYVDEQLKTTVKTKEDGSFLSDPIALFLGKNNIYGKTIENGQSSLASKTIELEYNNEKPTLEVTEPPDNHQINGGDRKVRVSGNTEPQNIVNINGVVVIVNGEGNFSMEVSLQDGDNTVNIVATSSFGNSTSLERKVNYSP